MKKFGKRIIILFLALIVAAVFCSCGSDSMMKAVEDGVGSYSNSVEESSNDIAAEYEDSAKSKSSVGSSEQLTDNRKIIEYVNLSVETKTFDKLIDGISSTVKQSGGYIENSEIGGNSYYGTERRSAQLKVRIPKAKQSDFSDYMSKNSNVVSRSVSTDDVTNQYIDTQSRIKALTLEKETLEKLLTQSANMSDTLTVYERLTSVIAEIESYQARLNQMDNLIEYTTFTINIDEVEKVTKVEKQSWFAKTWSGLLDSFSDVGMGLLDFVSFIIVALPYWILLGVIAVLIIIVIRHNKKKRNKKNMP